MVLIKEMQVAILEINYTKSARDYLSRVMSGFALHDLFTQRGVSPPPHPRIFGYRGSHLQKTASNYHTSNWKLYKGSKTAKEFLGEGLQMLADGIFSFSQPKCSL